MTTCLECIGLRPIVRAVLAIACAAAWSAACALDLATLDKVSVMMSFDQVKHLAGPPDDLGRMGPYTMATWRMTNTPAMIAAGGLFDERNALIAQAYVFAGETGAEALAAMRNIGFKVVDSGGVQRLYGNDDDTGRPLVIVIDDQPDVTTVYAYDQAEYEKRLAQGPLPMGPWTPVAISPAQPAASGGMDPATRAAIINGIGLMTGQMRPIQKTTTLSSSSSTTRNADGSITTRSRSTSVSVGADPAGVADALLKLMK